MTRSFESVCVVCSEERGKAEQNMSTATKQGSFQGGEAERHLKYLSIHSDILGAGALSAAPRKAACTRPDFKTDWRVVATRGVQCHT